VENVAHAPFALPPEGAGLTFIEAGGAPVREFAMDETQLGPWPAAHAIAMPPRDSPNAAQLIGEALSQQCRRRLKTDPVSSSTTAKGWAAVGTLFPTLLDHPSVLMSSLLSRGASDRTYARVKWSLSR
jgi:hypothetical protein